MPRTRPVFAALAAVVLSSHAAGAQEVQWRHDYAAARREAAQTGRPLLIDIGTEACFWCKKLDATTFRDPNVAKLLNERFIPVKVDAGKDERLAAGLGAEGYPTLVLAGADGKVVGRHGGYADAAQLTALLNKAPAPAAATPAAARPAVAPATDPRRAKEQLEADLAALHPKLAAALDR